jgi:hypothetical protein
MKSINMILMKAKLKHYKNIKRERVRARSWSKQPSS